jgi:VanZ family protein
MRKYARFIPAGIVALIILGASVMPAQTIESAGLSKEIYHIKGHFLFYGLFCLTLYKGFGKTGISLGIAILYGTLMELLQRHVPGRAFEYLDIAVNSLGALLASAILWKKSSLLPKKLNNWLDK